MGLLIIIFVFINIITIAITLSKILLISTATSAYFRIKNMLNIILKIHCFNENNDSEFFNHIFLLISMVF